MTEPWMPSDHQIHKASASCVEFCGRNWEPIRVLIRAAVDQALAELEAQHKRELIETRIDAIENFDGWTSFEWVKEMRAKLAAQEGEP